MTRSISLQEVGANGDLRIDAHHFVLLAKVEEVTSGILRGVPLASPGMLRVRNGENLPASLYIRDGEESDVLYASVGALSQFAFRADTCVPLKKGVGGLSDEEVDTLACQSNELLITRSGTPGIAWSPAFSSDPAIDPSIIPSGFVIRCECNLEVLDPRYAVAVLNHPVWRLWSASLAAGKRQRNLSQEHLATIILPALGLDEQAQVGEMYAAALQDVAGYLSDPHLLDRLCDSVLKEVCGLVVPTSSISVGVAERVTLEGISASASLRIDHRHLREDMKQVAGFVRSQPGTTFRTLVASVIRSGQPSILAVDASEPPRVIATGSIQLGQIDEINTKQTRFDDPDAASSRLVAKNDILLAMDGQGSIGKAAVFEGDYDAICDSHVAIFRLEDPSLAHALACFINSSLGQNQLSRHISGATGQIQISVEDVLSTWIPNSVLARAASVSRDYRCALQKFEGIIGRVRRRISLASSEVSRLLIASDTLNKGAKTFLDEHKSAESLFNLLAILKPKMF